MFEQKRYALFFRTVNSSSETPIEHRIYKCVDGPESVMGTRKEIRTKVKEYIPIFVDKIKIDMVPFELLPIIGDR